MRSSQGTNFALMAQTENLIFYYLCRIDEETEPLAQSREYYICKQLKIPIFSLEYYAEKQPETHLISSQKPQDFLIRYVDNQTEASRFPDKVH
jgi:hypothetical protein